jgi:hypothetical protein
MHATPKQAPQAIVGIPTKDAILRRFYPHIEQMRVSSQDM